MQAPDLLFPARYDTLYSLLKFGSITMELCDYYLKYVNALCEGTLAAPEGIALSGETPE